MAPSSSQRLVAVYGNENWSTTVNGIDNEFFKVRNWTVQAGRQFLDSELRAGKAVCLIGATVRKELFGDQSPLEQPDPPGQFLLPGGRACWRPRASPPSARIRTTWS